MQAEGPRLRAWSCPAKMRPERSLPSLPPDRWLSRTSAYERSGTDRELAAELAPTRTAFDQELRAEFRGEKPLVYLCIRLDEVTELRGRHWRDFGAFARKPLADIRICENLVDVL